MGDTKGGKWATKKLFFELAHKRNYLKSTIQKVVNQETNYEALGRFSIG